MTTKTRERTPARPEAVALRRATYAEAQIASLKADTARINRDLADMREDRDRWRAQAEKLTAALERLRAPATVERVKVIAPPAAPPRPPANVEEADFLSGYEAIAEFLGLTHRQVKHRALTGSLPVFKMGRVPCATRSALRSLLAAQMTAAQEGR